MMKCHFGDIATFEISRNCFKCTFFQSLVKTWHLDRTHSYENTGMSDSNQDDPMRPLLIQIRHKHLLTFQSLNLTFQQMRHVATACIVNTLPPSSHERLLCGGMGRGSRLSLPGSTFGTVARRAAPDLWHPRNGGFSSTESRGLRPTSTLMRCFDSCHVSLMAPVKVVRSLLSIRHSFL